MYGIDGRVFSSPKSFLINSGMSDMSNKNGLSEQLSRFKKGILCSAALHVQSNGNGFILDALEPPSHEDAKASEPDIGAWHNYPLLRKGVF